MYSFHLRCRISFIIFRGNKGGNGQFAKYHGCRNRSILVGLFVGRPDSLSHGLVLPREQHYPCFEQPTLNVIRRIPDVSENVEGIDIMTEERRCIPNNVTNQYNHYI